jgi:hypothetical protein
VGLTYVESWALAFALTQIIEMPIYRALAPVGWWRAFLLSAVTHPIVWYAIPPLCERAGLGYGQLLWIAEAFAYLVEAAMLRAWGLRWWRAIAVSAIANTASFAIGEVLRVVWDFP